MNAVKLEVNQIAEDKKLPNEFLKFFTKLHVRFGPHQKRLKLLRSERMAFARIGNFPKHLDSQRDMNWKVDLPDFLKDQRNQMTGPADNAELVIKLINSGAPGVMLDLEDSVANNPTRIMEAHANIKLAAAGILCHYKDGKSISLNPLPSTVVWIRPRGLHMDQIFPTLTKKVFRGSASLFDLAYYFYDMDYKSLRHPPCIYIPKSESAGEASWWRQVFTYIEKLRGMPHGTIKCMALVESFPLAHEMDEFLYNLRPYIVGLNLGRWDYMASLADYTLEDKKMVLPDRNKIPHDVEFFQRLRKLMVATCHRRGALAIGGMTALFPSRTNQEVNKAALEVLFKDKMNEANLGMDGAWTGHPDQNKVAVNSFPAPNQITSFEVDKKILDSKPELKLSASGPVTEEGSREAIRTVLIYRAAVSQGKGAVLISNFMEDLATDRIYRIMLAQRIKWGHLTTDRFEEIVAEESEKLEVDNKQQIAQIVTDLIYNAKFNPE